jgi:hypothetical protein
MKKGSLFVRMQMSAFLMLATLGTASCGMVIHHLQHGFVKAPAKSEFGLGSRTSASGAFTAALEPSSALRVGPLQSAELTLTDATGNPVCDAMVTIDGGMPQHGHGLPTKPRVTSTSVPGVYLVEGLRFNMGGWWEVRFAVSGASMRDSVTFNIRL